MKIEEFFKISSIQEAINSGNFELIYNSLLSYDVKVSTFTYIMLSSGVNPLEFMDEVPKYYFYYPTSKEREIKEIYIPDNVTKIKVYAFANSKIEKVRMSPNIVTIEPEAFFNCENLKEIVLPEKLEVIRKHAFGSCLDLKNIRFEGTKKQLNEMYLLGDPFKEVATSTIHCIDGDVEIDSLRIP